MYLFLPLIHTTLTTTIAIPGGVPGTYSISVAGQLRIGHRPLPRLLWKADYLHSIGHTTQAMATLEDIHARGMQNR